MIKQTMTFIFSLLLFSFSIQSHALPEECEALVKKMESQTGGDTDKSYDFIVVEADEDVEGEDVGLCGNGYKVVARENSPS